MARSKLTIPELVERYPAEWRALSPQQLRFVIEYIAGGLANGKYDARAAARIAYPHVKKITVWANRLLVNPRIKKMITLHQGLSEADVLIADVRSIFTKLRRANANPNVLVAPLLQVAAGLKAYLAAKGNAHDQ